MGQGIIEFISIQHITDFIFDKIDRQPSFISHFDRSMTFSVSHVK